MSLITNSVEIDEERDQEERKKSPILLSKELNDFYASHNVDLTGLLEGSTQENNASPLPHRFIRLNPRHNQNETLALLGRELGGGKEAVPVPWLQDNWGFYALPGNFPLATSQCFRRGRIYGMDVSSGAGVAALLSSNYDKKPCESYTKSLHGVRVLDLCCAPGLKICAMADFLQERKATLVGVDISENRMAVCKNIVQKYHVDPETCRKQSQSGAATIQLYCQDGTTFGMDQKESNLVFDSRAAVEELSSRGKRKRMNKSARARERKRLRRLASRDWHSSVDDTQVAEPKIDLFDYVLVDAECSTDGSLKHMKERAKDITTKEEKNPMLTNQAQLADLVNLQKRLIASGFRLLRPGGALVYSTCSLSQEQNENVVQWLLHKFSDSELVPVRFLSARSKLVSEGNLQGTVRFYPNCGNDDSTAYFGDGFFLAKIMKRQNDV